VGLVLLSWNFEVVKGFIMLKKLASGVVEFLAREDGPTAVEYAVMLALIIVVCITAISTLGSNANNTFSTVAAQIGGTGS
jgi:pilus assembly protein Flp/PilA